ncbi:response regulator [Flexivirga caeni]|uniref:DNA-binding response regulator n=1 Tax=Flexivirga caeni TaxID=2294115 RepID=A0A3M9MJS6_9MICO|nr:response regulator transcription factor [Flexivirga caeni]RNI25435.1 DNA-binding response regulator [Flexivirga caeni]
MTVRVVLADDQTVVREGLRSLLGLIEGIDVVGVAADAETALELVGQTDPDVLLTDLRMPGIGGVEGIRRLRGGRSRTQAVALTTYDDDATIVEALSAGALGFLNKDADPATIADAIRAAASGRSLLDAKATRAMLQRPGEATPTAYEPPDGLTEREVDVLRLVASGLANPQIARELFVSVSTVKTHINHVLAKTGCTGRAALVRYAYEHGLAG